MYNCNVCNIHFCTTKVSIVFSPCRLIGATMMDDECMAVVMAAMKRNRAIKRLT